MQILILYIEKNNNIETINSILIYKIIDLSTIPESLLIVLLVTNS